MMRGTVCVVCLCVHLAKISVVCLFVFLQNFLIFIINFAFCILRFIFIYIILCLGFRLRFSNADLHPNSPSNSSELVDCGSVASCVALTGWLAGCIMMSAFECLRYTSTLCKM